MDNPITRAEHEEFRRRMEEEHSRVNKRLELLEGSVDRLHEVNASIKELAVNMKLMLEEQERQGLRLKALEDRDGKNWRGFVKAAATVVISAAVGYLLRVIGIGG